MASNETTALIGLALKYINNTGEVSKEIQKGVDNIQKKVGDIELTPSIDSKAIEEKAKKINELLSNRKFNNVNIGKDMSTLVKMFTNGETKSEELNAQLDETYDRLSMIGRMMSEFKSVSSGANVADAMPMLKVKEQEELINAYKKLEEKRNKLYNETNKSVGKYIHQANTVNIDDILKETEVTDKLKESTKELSDIQKLFGADSITDDVKKYQELDLIYKQLGSDLKDIPKDTTDTSKLQQRVVLEGKYLKVAEEINKIERNNGVKWSEGLQASTSKSALKNAEESLKQMFTGNFENEFLATFNKIVKNVKTNINGIAKDLGFDIDDGNIENTISLLNELKVGAEEAKKKIEEMVNVDGSRLLSFDKDKEGNKKFAMYVQSYLNQGGKLEDLSSEIQAKFKKLTTAAESGTIVTSEINKVIDSTNKLFEQHLGTGNGDVFEVQDFDHVKKNVEDLRAELDLFKEKLAAVGTNTGFKDATASAETFRLKLNEVNEKLNNVDNAIANLHDLSDKGIKVTYNTDDTETLDPNKDKEELTKLASEIKEIKSTITGEISQIDDNFGQVAINFQNKLLDVISEFGNKLNSVFTEADYTSFTNGLKSSLEGALSDFKQMLPSILASVDLSGTSEIKDNVTNNVKSSLNSANSTKTENNISNIPEQSEEIKSLYLEIINTNNALKTLGQDTGLSEAIIDVEKLEDAFDQFYDAANSYDLKLLVDSAKKDMQEAINEAKSYADELDTDYYEERDDFDGYGIDSGNFIDEDALLEEQSEIYDKLLENINADSTQLKSKMEELLKIDPDLSSFSDAQLEDLATNEKLNSLLSEQINLRKQAKQNISTTHATDTNNSEVENIQKESNEIKNTEEKATDLLGLLKRIATAVETLSSNPVTINMDSLDLLSDKLDSIANQLSSLTSKEFVVKMSTSGEDSNISNDTMSDDNSELNKVEKVIEAQHEEQQVLEDTEKQHRELAQSVEDEEQKVVASVEKEKSAYIEAYEKLEALRKKESEIRSKSSSMAYNNELLGLYEKKGNQYFNLDSDELSSKINEELSEFNSIDDSWKDVDIEKHWTTIIALVDVYKKKTKEAFEFSGENSIQKQNLLLQKQSEIYEKISEAYNRRKNNVDPEVDIARQVSTAKQEFDKLSVSALEVDKAEIAVRELVGTMESLEDIDLNANAFKTFFKTFQEYQSSGGEKMIQDFTKSENVIQAINDKQQEYDSIQVQEMNKRKQQAAETMEMMKSSKESDINDNAVDLNSDLTNGNNLDDESETLLSVLSKIKNKIYEINTEEFKFNFDSSSLNEVIDKLNEISEKIGEVKTTAGMSKNEPVLDLSEETSQLETFEEKYEYLKQLKKDDKSIYSLESQLDDLDNKGNYGGKYDEIETRLSSAKERLEEFSNEYSKMIIKFKNGESLEYSGYNTNDNSLEELKLVKSKIEDIIFVKNELSEPIKNDIIPDNESKQAETLLSVLKEIREAISQLNIKDFSFKFDDTSINNILKKLNEVIEKKAEIASKKTGTTSTLLQSSPESDNSDFKGEAEKANELEEEIKSITSAVESKNAAFKEEREIVDGVVTSEVNNFEVLSGEILSVVGDVEKLTSELKEAFTNQGIDIKINATEGDFSSLEALTDGRINSSSIDTITESLNKLSESIGKIRVDENLSSSLSSLKELSDINIRKSSGDNLQRIADAVFTLKNNLNNLGDGGKEFLNSIKEIVSSTEGLKELNKTLASSAEKIKEAKEATNGKVTSDNAKKSANDTNESYAIIKQNLKEIISLTKQIPKASGESRNEIESNISKYQASIDEEKAAIKKRNNGSKSKDNEISIMEDQLKSVIELNKQIENSQKPISEEIKNNTDEWEKAVSTLGVYKEELGQIATIVRSMKVNSDGFEQISYKVTDIDGNSRTIGKNGELVASSNTVVDNTNIQKIQTADSNDSYSASRKYLNEIYSLKKKISEIKTSKADQSEIPLLKNKISQYERLLVVEKEERAYEGWDNELKDVDLENQELRLKENLRVEEKAYQETLQQRINILHEQALLENELRNNKEKEKSQSKTSSASYKDSEKYLTQIYNLQDKINKIENSKEYNEKSYKKAQSYQEQIEVLRELIEQEKTYRNLNQLDTSNGDNSYKTLENKLIEKNKTKLQTYKSQLYESIPSIMENANTEDNDRSREKVLAIEQEEFEARKAAAQQVKEYNEYLEQRAKLEAEGKAQMQEYYKSLQQKTHKEQSGVISDYEKYIKQYYDAETKIAKDKTGRTNSYEGDSLRAYQQIVSLKEKIDSFDDIDVSLQKRLSDIEDKRLEKQRDLNALKNDNLSKDAFSSSGSEILTITDAYEKLARTQKDYVKLTTKQKYGELTNNEVIKLEEINSKRKEALDVINRVTVLTAEEANAQQKYNAAVAEGEKYKGIVEAQRTVALEKYGSVLSETKQKMEALKGADIDNFGEVFERSQRDVEMLNNKLLSGKISLDKYHESIDKISNSLSSTVKVLGKDASIDSISSSMKNYFNELSAGKAKIGELKDSVSSSGQAIHKMSAEWKEADGNIRTVTLSCSGVENSIKKVSEITRTATSAFDGFFGKLKERWVEVFRYALSFASFYDIIRIVREGVTMVQELDTALTEMRKVSDESTESLKAFQEESYGMADAVGTTATTLQTSTADWMRLGESLDEAKESAQDTTILLNVSEFDSIDDATDSLVAMSQAYDDLSKVDIIDKLNNIGNNYAISTDEAATALQKSASALTTAGNDMDEALALITAGNAVVQDADSVGAGMRTIALRLTGTTAAQEELEEEDSTDAEGMITTASKLRDTIKTATSVASNGFEGFDIFDDNGNYKSTYEIMKGIAEIYDEIVESDEEYGDNKKNLLLETMAGKNRANIAASILQNPDLLESAYGDSQTSEGSAEKENEKYLDSIEGKVEQLQNRLQELASNALNSDLIKGFIDIGTNALEFLNNIINKLGLAQTLLLSIAAIFTTKKIFGGNITKGLDNLISGLNSLKFDNIKDKLQKWSGFNIDLEIEPDLDVNLASNVIKKFQSDLSVNLQDTLSDIGDDTLSSMNLFRNESGEIAASEALTAAKLQESTAYQALSAEKQQAILTSLGLTEAEVAETTSSTALSKEKLSQLLANKSLSVSQIEQLSTLLGLTVAEDGNIISTSALTKEELALALSEMGVTEATFNQIMAMMGYESVIDILTVKLGVLGTTLKTFFLTNPLGWLMLGAGAIAGTVFAIDKFTTSAKEAAEARENVASAYEDAKSSIESTTSSINENSATVKENADRYAELAQGVNQFTHANINLSNDEYDEFLNISNQLSDVFPELTTGYDENGNAILNLSGNVSTITDKLYGLLDVQNQLANQEIVDKMPDISAGWAMDLQDAEDTLSDAEDQIKSIDNAYKVLSGSSAFDSGYSTDNTGVSQQQFEDALNLFGINAQQNKTWDNTNGYITTYSANELVTTGALQSKYDQLINGAKIEKENYISALQSTEDEINSYLSTWLSTDSLYNTYDSNLQSSINSMVGTIDWQSFFDGWSSKDLEDGDKVFEAMTDYISSNYLNSISSLGDEAKSELTSALSMSESDFDSLDEYLAYIDEIKSKFTKDGEYGVEIPITFPNEDDLKSKQSEFEQNIKDLAQSTADASGGTVNTSQVLESLNSFIEDNNITTSEAIDLWTQYTSGMTDAAKAMSTYTSAMGLSTSYTSEQNKAIKDYNEQMEILAKKEANTSDSDKMVGNINMYDRPFIYWDDETLKNQKSTLKSLGYSKEDREALSGSYSTLMGMSNNIESGALVNAQIRYTPIMKDENGQAKLLDGDTLNKYISKITENATSESDILAADKLGAYIDLTDSDGNIIGKQYVSGIVEGISQASDSMYKTIAKSLSNDNSKTKKELGNNLISSIEDIYKDSFDNLSEDDLSTFQDTIYDVVFGYDKKGSSLDEFANSLDGDLQYILNIAQSSMDEMLAHTNAVNFEENVGTALENLASVGISQSDLISQYYSDMADDIGESIDSIWDSSDFEDSRSDLEELANTSGITAADIDDLAASDSNLQDILDSTGMSASYLAQCFNSMALNGDSALDLISADAIKVNTLLSQMKDRYNDVQTAYAEYSASLDQGDYNDDLANYETAYDSLGDMFEAGEYGKDFYRTVDYLFGEGNATKSVDELYKIYKSNKSLYAPETADSDDDSDTQSQNGYGLLKKLYKDQDKIKGLSGKTSVEKSASGGYTFDIDESDYAAIAKYYNTTEEGITSCVEALGMFGDYAEYSDEQLLNTFKDLDMAMYTFKDNTALSTQGVEELLSSLGLEQWQIEQIIKQLKESDQISLIDFSGTSDKSIAKQLKKLQALKDENGDSVVQGSLKEGLDYESYLQAMSNMGMSWDEIKEKTEEYYDYFNENGYTFVDSTGEAITSWEQLDADIDATIEKGAVTVLSSQLQQLKTNAEEALNTFNLNNGTSYSYNLDTTEVDDAQSQIEQFQSDFSNYFKNGSDGVLDLSADVDEESFNNALNIYAGLLAQKQQLDQPDIMSVSVAAVDDTELAADIQEIQDIVNLQNTIEIKTKMGATDEEIQDYKDQLNKKLNEDYTGDNQFLINAGIEIDEDSTYDDVEEMINNLSTYTLQSIYGLDTSAFVDMTDSLTSAADSLNELFSGTKKLKLDIETDSDGNKTIGVSFESTEEGEENLIKSAEQATEEGTKEGAEKGTATGASAGISAALANNVNTNLQKSTASSIDKSTDISKLVSPYITDNALTLTANVDTDEAKSKLEALTSIEDVKFTIDADGKPAVEEENTVKTAAQELTASPWTLSINAKSILTGLPSKIKQWLNGKLSFGNSSAGTKTTEANGTFNAHAFGTLGAYASGSDVSISSNETALVNELGNEGIVRNGKLYEIQGGAQFMDLKKGDIVFNHKQMDELNKNGHITSDGGHGNMIGAAHAMGTVGSAYVTGSANNDNTHDKIENASGKTSKTSSSSSDSSSSNSKTSASDLFDWIEIRLDRLQRKFDNWATKASNTYTTYGKRIKYVNQELAYNSKLITANSKGYKKYMKKANSVKLSDSLKKKVQNGSIDISKYSEDTQTLIESYQTWYEKAISCKDALEELNQTATELKLEKLQLKIDQLSDSYDHLDSTINKAQSNLDLMETLGQSAGKGNYKTMFNAQAQQMKNLNNQNAYLKQQQKLVKKGSEAWNEYQASIDSNNESLKDLLNTMQETAIESYNLVNTNAESKNDKVETKKELLEAKLDNASDATSKNTLLKSEISANNSELSNLKTAASNAATAQTSAKTSINSGASASSLKKMTKANKNTYSTLLTSVKKYVNAGNIVPESVMTKIQNTMKGLDTSSVLYKELNILLKRVANWNAAVLAKETADANYELSKETTKTENSALALEEVQNYIDDGENEVDLISAKTSAGVESEVKINSSRGVSESKTQYQQQINASSAKLAALQKARNDAWTKLQAQKSIMSDEDYNTAYKAILNIDTEIADCTAEQIEWNNAIEQLDITRLEKLSDIIDSLQSKLSNLISLAEAHGNTASDSIILNQISASVDQMNYDQELMKEYFDRIERKFSSGGDWSTALGNLSLSNSQLSQLETLIKNRNSSGIKNFFEQLGVDYSTLTELQETMDGYWSAEDDYYNQIISQEEYYDNLIDNRISAIDDLIDALDKVNDAEDRALKLEQARYDLEKAKNNKTQKVWNGQEWVYQADTNAIKDAQEALDDAEHEELMNKLDDIKDALEDLKDDNNLYDDEGNLTEDGFKSISELLNTITSKYLTPTKALIASLYPDMASQWDEIFEKFITAEGNTASTIDLSSITLSNDLSSMVADSANLIAMTDDENTQTTEEVITEKAQEVIRALNEVQYVLVDALNTCTYQKIDALNILASTVMGQLLGTMYDLSHTELNAIMGELYSIENTVNRAASSISNSVYAMASAAASAAASSSTNSLTKCATGGVITGNDNNDNTLIRVSSKERVLTPIQNTSFETLTYDIMPDLLNAYNQVPDILSTLSSAKSVNTSSQVITQEFNITMPNVTDSTTAQQLMSDLQALSTKKIQRYN